MDCLEHFYEFSPSNKRLIDAYLRPKIAGNDVGGDCIHDADVNSDHPYNLVRKHAPASGSDSANGDDRVWFFFSPERYVGGGGGKTRGRRGSESRNRNRERTVFGADGKKKGAWHSEGKIKTVAGTTGGGYFRSLSYEEVTPSGSAIRPGWRMLEYGIGEEHGGGSMVLCQVYKSHRATGSDASSRKRKAYVPEAEHFRQPRQRTHQEEGMPFAGRLEREDLTDFRAGAAAPAFQETMHVWGSVVVESAAANQCTGTADQVPEDQEPDFNYQESLLQEYQPGSAVPPPCAVLTADEDDVMEISFEDFWSSSARAAAVPQQCAAQPEDNAAVPQTCAAQPEHDAVVPPPHAAQPEDDAAVPPPCSAQPEDAAVPCVQMSQEQVAAADGDETEFTLELLEELMGSSSTPGQLSSTPSPLAGDDDDNSHDDDDDDNSHDDDDMCGLACPPMDYGFLDNPVQSDPSILEEDFWGSSAPAAAVPQPCTASQPEDNAAVPQTCASQPEDDVAVPPPHAAQTEDDAVVPPPCAAQPEDAAVPCVQMSQEQVQAADGDMSEFALELLEELMGSSSTPGQLSSTPRPLAGDDDDNRHDDDNGDDKDDDDDDDDDMCGLACPPMDYDFLNDPVQSDPSMLEEEFTCDLLDDSQF